MCTPTTVYLLRHAESRPDPSVPEPDWPLSARGRQQAEELVAALRTLSIDYIYSSPYRRAVETVWPFAASMGLEIRIEPELHERQLAEGFVPDIRAAVLQTWADFAFAHPGGESNADCQRRIVRAVQEIAPRHPGGRVLLASHGNAIALFLNALDPMFGFDAWSAMRNPDLFRFELRDGALTWDRSWTLKLGQ